MGEVPLVLLPSVDVGGVGHIATAGAGAVAIISAVVVVVRIFCVEGQSWWTKMAVGVRYVGGDKVGREASGGRVARAVVFNEVFITVITRLKEEDEGICAVHISGEGIKPTH
jgi:hypothetical protein